MLALAQHPAPTPAHRSLAGGAHGRYSGVLPGPCAAGQALWVGQAGAWPGPAHARRCPQLVSAGVAETGPDDTLPGMLCRITLAASPLHPRKAPQACQGHEEAAKWHAGLFLPWHALSAGMKGACVAAPPPGVLLKQWLIHVLGLDYSKLLG